jgi:hypothetical protein
MSRSYYPAACLYDAKTADCTAPVAAEPMVVDDDAPELRLSPAKDGTLIVGVASAHDKPVGEWRFGVNGGQLKTVAQTGGGPAPK